MADGTRPWHAVPAEDALRALEAAPEGLSQDEVRARQEKHGPNELPARKAEGALTLLWRQIHNPLIWVLIGAGALALVMGKATDAIVVFGVVVLNTLIGFFQELRAGRAIEALSQMVPRTATVLRAGQRQSIPAQELVPGDVVLLASGDQVPADLRLLEARNVHADEAPLTGESVPVSKRVDPVEESAQVGDRQSMLFGGTSVTSGSAKAVVVATGRKTELGRISGLLEEAVELKTPLTVQLGKLGRLITFAIVAVSALLIPLALLRQYPWVDALLVAITLAVAAIPEGLPAIVTIALAIGVQRMAARKAIIRQLPAVETLGSTTVICTDKTGTLTRNEMTVQALWTPRSEVRVTGVGYAPDGQLAPAEGEAGADAGPLAEVPDDVRRLLLAGVLCNDTSMQASDEGRKPAGDPTEAALLVAAEKAGIRPEDARCEHRREDAIPFESEHRYMATLHPELPGGPKILLKGAPEVVLEHCGPEGEVTREAVLEVVARYAARGMRVLAFAERRADGLSEVSTSHVGEGGFELLGLQGMIDPPRPEAIDAVATCQKAGVTVKMITGDHAETARAIGEQLGLGGAKPVTGPELARLDEAGLRDAVLSTNVFARVAPEHKLRLVRALQSQGHVVAMTGDGVNDAPALEQANIGVAMGITGTAVARESSDIILADDNFASIAAAVEQGRRVYDNLLKSIAFVLPTNLGLALILMAAVALFPVSIVAGEPVPLLPMLPRQILWINLVASVALSFPLALEVAERDVMRRPPRPPSQPLFGRFLISRTILVAVLMAAAGVGGFLWAYARGDGNVAEAQTVAVTTLTSFQCFYLFTCRSLRESSLRLGLFSNPWIFVGVGALAALQLAFIYVPFMQSLFGTSSLTGLELGLAAASGVLVLPLIALEKRFFNRRRAQHQKTRQERLPPGGPRRVLQRA